MGGNYVSQRDDSERGSWQNHNIIPAPTLVHEYPSYGVSGFCLADPAARSSQVSHGSPFAFLGADVKLVQ